MPTYDVTVSRHDGDQRTDRVVGELDPDGTWTIVFRDGHAVGAWPTEYVISILEVEAQPTDLALLTEAITTAQDEARADGRDQGPRAIATYLIDNGWCRRPDLQFRRVGTLRHRDDDGQLALYQDGGDANEGDDVYVMATADG